MGKAGYDRICVRTYDTEIEDNKSNVVIKTNLSISAIHMQRILTLTSTTTIYADGRINFNIQGDKTPEMPYLPRFGLRLFIPKSYKNVKYLGYGPYESYVDKHQASYYRFFTDKISNMHEDYIKPQENSSHYGTDFLYMENNKKCFKVYGNSFSFNASEYTQEELMTKQHNYELEKSEYNILCLDSNHSGIGSNSCGPVLKDEYRVNEVSLNLDLVFDSKMF